MASWYESIPAPMDSNGIVVPLDTKKLVHKGETREVYRFVYSIRLECWFVEFWECDDIFLGACTMPDSWESLEKDAGKAPREYIEGRGITAGKDGRVAAMTGDLVRRAKALSGLH